MNVREMEERIAFYRSRYENAEVTKEQAYRQKIHELEATVARQRVQLEKLEEELDMCELKYEKTKDTLFDKLLNRLCENRYD